MSHYIDADQLRKEIERLYEEHISREYRDEAALVLEELEDFLDSLPEQTVIKKSNALFDKCVENCDPAVMKEVSDNVDKILASDGLEEAADKQAFIESPYCWESQPGTFGSTPLFLMSNIRSAFKAGAEWQKAKILKDDPVILPVEDFQALIDSHAKRVEADYKERMLKDAVEIEVKEDAGGFPIVPLDVIELYDYEKDKPLAKAGDKVKVIVIKEDEL